jgi:hypothetical protein
VTSSVSVLRPTWLRVEGRCGELDADIDSRKVVDVGVLVKVEYLLPGRLQTDENVGLRG